jgi:dehydrogenase/reductase SDR family protein 7
MKYIIIVIIAILAVFFSNDCDLLLQFLPYGEKEARSSYQGKVVWITGASSGIGARLALDYASSGAQVILSARRVDQLESVARDCANRGQMPLVLPLDVTDDAAQAATFSKIIEQFGHIDILVLNAGRSQRALAINTHINDTRSLFELNVMAYISLTRLVVPSFLKRGSGDIVVVSSIAGKVTTPVSSSYAATKHALQGYFDTLRSEVFAHGVGVLVVCPGPVKSEIVENAIRGDTSSLTGKQVYEQDENIMTTERCTQLILKALHYKYDEVWLSDQPFLAITYLSVYAPWITRQLMKHFIGPSRVRAFIEGASVFDFKLILKQAFFGNK